MIITSQSSLLFFFIGVVPAPSSANEDSAGGLAACKEAGEWPAGGPTACREAAVWAKIHSEGRMIMGVIHVHTGD